MTNESDGRRDSASDKEERVDARRDESAGRGPGAESRARALRMVKLALVLLTAAGALFFFAARSDARRQNSGKGGKPVTESERQTDANAQRMLNEGK